MVEDGARVIDAGFAPRVRQMQAQHRATIATIRAQLEVLPDVAAELEEQGTESVVRTPTLLTCTAREPTGPSGS